MRYQFQSEHSNYPIKSQRFTDVIKALISINAVLFLLRYFMMNQFDLLSLGLSSSPKLWQPITYMFVHGDFFHIFMNFHVRTGKNISAVFSITVFPSGNNTTSIFN